MTRLSARAARACALAALCALAAACSDGNPLASAGTPAAPAPATPVMVASVHCDANVKSRTVSCGEASLPQNVRGYIIVGGQHSYVNLASSNVTYDGSQVFAFDVTVQNLIAQAMGTTDGVTPDANGVRVIFASGPVVTGGTGGVSVANADGMGTFTGTNQPYFQYAGSDLGGDGLLSTSETSAARNWHLNVDNTVTAFGFTLYVVTEVKLPNGWIDVLGVPSNLLAGGTAAATDSVRSAVGALSPNQGGVTWGTSDASVATVDGSGNITAVAPGTATITATQGLRSGSVTIGVCPNLPVGGVYTATFPAAASTCFGGGGSAEEFTYMPLNVSTSAALSLSVTGKGVQAVTGPPSPNRIPLLGGALALRTPSPLEPQPGSDIDILERADRQTAPLARNPAALLRRGARGVRGPRFTITPNVVPAVGDSMDLDVAQDCRGAPDIRRGVVRSVKQHLIIVSDTANPAGGFTTAQYDSIALEFDTLAWKVDSTNFGPPTDLDGNGHVVAFFTRAVNELTPPPPNNTQYTLGYFHSKDVFARSASGCPTSNEGEMFYMLVPDPTGAVNSNVRTVSSVRSGTTGTLAHEFQHLINAWRKVYVVSGFTDFEQGWLNEGLSHVAEELMFYKASGMSPRVNIRLGTDATSGIQLNSRRVAAFNAYANPNFGRLHGWLQQPDTAGAFTPHANSLAVRGAIWAFLRYSADRLGAANEQAFWYNLVNTNTLGKANLQNGIGANPDLWLRDFTAAFYADDVAGITMAPQYTTPSWNYRSMYSALGGYSLLTRPLTNNVTTSFTAALGGAAGYVRFGVAASSFASVTTYGPGQTIPTSPFQLIVVRTK